MAESYKYNTAIHYSFLIFMNNSLQERYRSSLVLLTDLYQLTMAYGYWKAGRATEEAVFHLFYRKNPFKGNYAIACGLQDVVEFLVQFQFTPSDIRYLETLKGADDAPLFEADFLAYLAAMDFSCDVDAMPEGTVVFPHEPILRIKGPLIQAQLIETALLNIINFQTLIATKSARIVTAAQGDMVLEFGLRRAQGIDGGLSASRAAYIGGCHATSNVLASKIYGIPVKGTHAHSWVMSFEEEEAAFLAYAATMPNNCVFLVDTYDTIKGVKKAIKVGRKLRKKGHQLLGIRLDSGDLAALSSKARTLLDKAGFEATKIVASDSLNEYKLAVLKERGAKITVWGIGTNLVTAEDQPALGGVYKLAATRKKGAAWKYKIKLSDTPIKTSTPGLLQVRRYFMSDGKPFGDMIWNIENSEPIPELQSFDGRNIIATDRLFQDLLVPIFRNGAAIYELPTIETIRNNSLAQVQLFEGVDFDYYPTGLEQKLNAQKIEEIKKIKKRC